MTDLDEASRTYVDRERSAWAELPPPRPDAPARAFAEGARRRAALARIRLFRGIAIGVIIVAALGGLLATRRGAISPQGQTTIRRQVDDVGSGVGASPTESRPSTHGASGSSGTRDLHSPPAATTPTPDASPAIGARADEAPVVRTVPRRRGDAPAATGPSAPASEVESSRGGASASEDALQAEFRLLREARLAIRDGHLEQALTICVEHASHHPNGVLTPERRALERRARCLLAERSGSAPPEGCR